MRRGRIDLAELIRLPLIGMVKPNWQRNQVAYFSNQTGRNEIYTIDLQTREVRQVTNGEAPNAPRTGYCWSRDGSALIFGRDKAGDERNNLYRLDLGSGEVEQLNDDPESQEHPGEMAPDDRALLLSSDRNGQMNLFRLDLQDRSWHQLTQFAAPVHARSASWSPDGRWIAFSSNETANLKNQDIYLIQADGTGLRKLLSLKTGSAEWLNDWHPKGKLAAITSDALGGNRPAILDLESLDVRWLGQDGVEEEAGEFSPSGRWLSALRCQESAVAPVLYEVATGQERPLHLPGGFALGVSFVLEERYLLIRYTTADRRSEILLYDLEHDRYEALIPAEYGRIDSALFVPDEHLYYPSFDGQQVPALLMKPHQIAPGERLPALIEVHGGPTHQHHRLFEPFLQVLADQGYVILRPNPRGSTGYGVTWRDAALKDWGGGDLEDIAAGAAFLKSLPFVDPDRIGIFGGSYGGYLTFMAVVKKPELFKVGIAQVGITDLHLLYDEQMAHFKYYLEQQMGHPEANRELWRERSAITYAEQLRAKLLILHGLNDPRCPISQARVFRDSLLELGRREGSDPAADFEYHEHADEGHGHGGSVEQQVRTYQLLIDFLQRRL